MADDYGDKTEAPTPKRRQEAREQGNVARSVDLTAAAVILGMLVLLQIQGPALVEALRGVTEKSFAADVLADHDPAGVATLVLGLLGTIAPALLPLLLGVALVAILVNLAQVGFFFNTKRLQPNFKAGHNWS
jgi:flagellar biosynthetic protein FlhB